MGDSQHTQNIQINKVIVENWWLLFYGKDLHGLWGQPNNYIKQLRLSRSKYSRAGFSGEDSGVRNEVYVVGIQMHPSVSGAPPLWNPTSGLLPPFPAGSSTCLWTWLPAPSPGNAAGGLTSHLPQHTPPCQSSLLTPASPDPGEQKAVLEAWEETPTLGNNRLSPD